MCTLSFWLQASCRTSGQHTFFQLFPISARHCSVQVCTCACAHSTRRFFHKLLLAALVVQLHLPPALADGSSQPKDPSVCSVNGEVLANPPRVSFRDASAEAPGFATDIVFYNNPDGPECQYSIAGGTCRLFWTSDEGYDHFEESDCPLPDNASDGAKERQQTAQERTSSALAHSSGAWQLLVVAAAALSAAVAAQLWG